MVYVDLYRAIVAQVSMRYNGLERAYKAPILYSTPLTETSGYVTARARQSLLYISTLELVTEVSGSQSRCLYVAFALLSLVSWQRKPIKAVSCQSKTVLELEDLMAYPVFSISSTKFGV